MHRNAMMATLALAAFSSGSLAQAPVRPPATAQAPSAAAPQPAPLPERSSVSFNDWLMRCETQQEAGRTRKVCEVFQGLQLQGQQGFFAQLALGRIQKADPLKLTAIVPNNITLPSTVQVAMAEGEPAFIDLQWRRCSPAGCVADIALAEPQIQRLRGKTDQIRIMFKDSTGRDIAVIVSMRGFAQSYDALLKEPTP
jgi:invasion protein IalB